jgi:hypothetical protein
MISNTYAGDNPVNFIDPSGMSLLGEIAGGLVGVTIAATGCLVTGVETAGVGCVAAVAVGSGVGAAIGGAATGDTASQVSEAGGGGALLVLVPYAILL